MTMNRGNGKGGNGHAKAHGEKNKLHPLVIKAGTITPEGTASAYCYACDDDVVDSHLEKHLGNITPQLRFHFVDHSIL
jgi:ubiquitin carboxyl-terminal hydrolase 5/13